MRGSRAPRGLIRQPMVDYQGNPTGLIPGALPVIEVPGLRGIIDVDAIREAFQALTDRIAYLTKRAQLASCAVNVGAVAVYGVAFNVASVVKNATGHWTVNLTTGASSSANVVVSVSLIGNKGFIYGAGGISTTIDIHIADTSGAAADLDFAMVVHDNG